MTKREKIQTFAIYVLREAGREMTAKEIRQELMQRKLLPKSWRITTQAIANYLKDCGEIKSRVVYRRSFGNNPTKLRVYYVEDG